MFLARGINGFYKMNIDKIGKGWFELGPIRPPSEGKDCSLLVRATRNCPWNRCEFCRTYKGQRYSVRTVEEIKADLDVVKGLVEEIKAASWKLGSSGVIDEKVVMVLVNSNPELYSRRSNNDADLVQKRLHSLVSVANWLYSGGRTVFLQDANTPQMRTADLVEIIRYLKESFPSVERVTSYARSKTIAGKTIEELRELHQAGLSRLHIGLESGCDEVLTEVKKGVTGEEHIIAGKKTKEVGITLSEYVMPGLGGRKWSEEHALKSARVLNEINPDFIRLRSFVPRRGTPLHDRVQAGEFEMLSEDEVVAEIGLFIENLNCNSYLVSDQMCNLLGEIEGQLPEDKPAILKIISEYLQKPLAERLKLQLERRLSSYVAICGGLDEDMAGMVEEVVNAIREEKPTAKQKVEAVLTKVKAAFI